MTESSIQQGYAGNMKFWIRIITTIVEVGNFTIMFTYLLAAVLNLVIMMLIIRYKEN